MLRLKTETLEVRGVANKQSAKGNSYTMMYCERHDGEAVEFYMRDLPVGLEKVKRGDKVVLYCERNRFGDLNVVEVVKDNGNN